MQNSAIFLFSPSLLLVPHWNGYYSHSRNGNSTLAPETVSILSPNFPSSSSLDETCAKIDCYWRNIGGAVGRETDQLPIESERKLEQAKRMIQYVTFLSLSPISSSSRRRRQVTEPVDLIACFLPILFKPRHTLASSLNKIDTKVALFFWSNNCIDSNNNNNNDNTFHNLIFSEIVSQVLCKMSIAQMEAQ